MSFVLSPRQRGCRWPVWMVGLLASLLAYLPVCLLPACLPKHVICFRFFLFSCLTFLVLVRHHGWLGYLQKKEGKRYTGSCSSGHAFEKSMLSHFCSPWEGLKKGKVAGWEGGGGRGPTLDNLTALVSRRKRSQPVGRCARVRYGPAAAFGRR